MFSFENLLVMSASRCTRRLRSLHRHSRQTMICCTPPPIRHAVQYGFKNLRAHIALICTSVKYRRRGWIRELVVAAGDASCRHRRASGGLAEREHKPLE